MQYELVGFISALKVSSSSRASYSGPQLESPVMCYVRTRNLAQDVIIQIEVGSCGSIADSSNQLIFTTRFGPAHTAFTGSVAAAMVIAMSEDLKRKITAVARLHHD